MILTETARPEDMGHGSYRELAPGVLQDEEGVLLIHDGESAVKITIEALPSLEME